MAVLHESFHLSGGQIGDFDGSDLQNLANLTVFDDAEAVSYKKFHHERKEIILLFVSFF